jgi:hypothetical protein
MTAISIVRTEQFIAVAADSASADGEGQPGPNQCKIRAVGRFFYTASNLTGDTGTGYSLLEIVMDNQHHESFELFAAAIRRDIRSPLLKALTAMRDAHPEYLMRNFGGKQVVSVYLFGLSRERPTVTNLEFRIHDVTASEMDIDVVERQCPGPDFPNGIMIGFVGPELIHQQFVNQCPNYWIGSAEVVAKNLEALVQMCIDNRTGNEAKPPISVLLVKPTGHQWLKRGLCC